MPDVSTLATLGVDTHAEVHVAAALDELGRQLGTIEVATTIGGFKLIEWASQFGVIGDGTRGQAHQVTSPGRWPYFEQPHPADRSKARHHGRPVGGSDRARPPSRILSPAQRQNTPE